MPFPSLIFFCLLSASLIGLSLTSVFLYNPQELVKKSKDKKTVNNVTEFLNALSKNDRGLNVDKALLEWIRRIQGWHIATMLTLSQPVFSKYLSLLSVRVDMICCQAFYETLYGSCSVLFSVAQ